MPAALTFIFGIGILLLFLWYFATESARRKRWAGTALAILLTAFCVEALTPPSEKITLGIDLKGGSSFLLQLTPGVNPDGTSRTLSPSAQAQAVAVIRNRIDGFGNKEAFIAAEGSDRILVRMPGISDDKRGEVRKQLEQVASLSFHLVDPASDAKVAAIEAGTDVIEPGYLLKTIKDSERSVYIKKRPDLTGDRITQAYPSYGPEGYQINIAFDSEGKELFGQLTSQHTGEQFAIVLDDEVLSAPVIREPIWGGSAVISGRFTDAEARSLASALENPLQTPLKILEERSVPATLGTKAIQSGVLAALAGLLLTLIFLVLYYRIGGLIALLGLVVNMVLLIGALAMFNFTLTLPGIAGIILTIGIAIDANVLIYERLKEELGAGKSLAAAIDAAYDKAFSAIFDANITTLLTAAILFWQATGAVRGFAITLTLGILGSLFAALLVTRTCFRWATEAAQVKKLSFGKPLGLLKDFDFIRAGRKALVLSALLVGCSLAILAWKGDSALGIDFRGGDAIELQPKVAVTQEQITTALADLELDELRVQIQQAVGDDREYVRIESEFGTSEKILTKLRGTLPEIGFDEGVKEDHIGPSIGRELAVNSAIALGIGLLAILLYVTLRFEFSFALGALIALFHDVLIAIGVVVITGTQLSLILVGAFLTIAGYSINDTIVVFDRIRESLRSGRRGEISDIMNQAIRITLRRTILTSATTLIAILTLYFFGGPELRSFSFAIIIGVIVGTYSSIFVASPIVHWWAKVRGLNLRREVLDAEEAKVIAPQKTG